MNDGSLTDLIAATDVGWGMLDVEAFTGGEIDMGGGERKIGYIVSLKDGRRFQLAAWRRSDGTVADHHAMQLPGLL